MDSYSSYEVQGDVHRRFLQHFAGKQSVCPFVCTLLDSRLFFQRSAVVLTLRLAAQNKVFVFF